MGFDDYDFMYPVVPEQPLDISKNLYFICFPPFLLTSSLLVSHIYILCNYKTYSLYALFLHLYEHCKFEY